MSGDQGAEPDWMWAVDGGGCQGPVTFHGPSWGGFPGEMIITATITVTAASVIAEHLIGVFLQPASYNPHYSPLRWVFYPPFQMRVLRISKIIHIPPGHIASKQQCWVSSFSLSGSQTPALMLRLYCLSSQGKLDRFPVV